MTWRRLLLGLAGAVCIPTAALAAGSSFDENNNWPQPQFSAHVDSRPDGVYVQVQARETVEGASPAPRLAGAAPLRGQTNEPPPEAAGGTSWADASGYHYRSNDGRAQDLTPARVSGTSPGFWSPQFAAHPGAAPYVLSVDNQNVSLVWIPGSANTQLGPPTANDTGPAGDGGGHDPYQVARYLETHIPLPNVQIKANPGMGLVGLPSWFWVQGYTGQPFGASQTVTIPPAIPGGQPTSFTVSVRISGDKYEWNFGDGSPALEGTLGKAYPQESDVRHLYQFSSFTLPNGFPIQLTVEFAAQYQVNGGGPQGLPPIEHSYRANLPVQQVQTTLSAPQRP